MNWIGGARNRAQQQQQQRGGGGGAWRTGFYQARGGGGFGGGRGRGRGRGGGDPREERPHIERRTNVEQQGRGRGWGQGQSRGRVGTLRGRRHVYYDPDRHHHLFDGASRDDDKKYSPLLDFIGRSGFPCGAALSLQLSHQMGIDRAVPERGDRGGPGVSENMDTGNNNNNGFDIAVGSSPEDAGVRDRDRDHNRINIDDELRGFSEEFMTEDDDISLFTSDTDQECPVPQHRSQGKIQDEGAFAFAFPRSPGPAAGFVTPDPAMFNGIFSDDAQDEEMSEFF